MRNEKESNKKKRDMKERTSIEQWKMKVKDERETRERGEMNSWERLKRGRRAERSLKLPMCLGVKCLMGVTKNPCP
jgi:hypothetical protein